MPAQILYSLSERHAHLMVEASDIPQNTRVRLIEALFLVMKHAAHLPRLHRQLGCGRDTALLMVRLP